MRGFFDSIFWLECTVLAVCGCCPFSDLLQGGGVLIATQHPMWAHDPIFAWIKSRCINDSLRGIYISHVYKHIHVYICSQHTHTYTHAHKHSHTDTRTYTRTHARAHTHSHTHTHTNTHTHTRTQIHTHTHTYTQTHTHTHTRTHNAHTHTRGHTSPLSIFACHCVTGFVCLCLRMCVNIHKHAFIVYILSSPPYPCNSPLLSIIKGFLHGVPWLRLYRLVSTRKHCNILQHAATHCTTLQHTATHCSTLDSDCIHSYPLVSTRIDCHRVQQHFYNTYSCNIESSAESKRTYSKRRSREISSSSRGLYFTLITTSDS